MLTNFSLLALVNRRQSGSPFISARNSMFSIDKVDFSKQIHHFVTNLHSFKVANSKFSHYLLSPLRVANIAYYDFDFNYIGVVSEDYGRILVQNCKFKQCHSDKHQGGAISISGYQTRTEDVAIICCEFINCSSSIKAGAVSIASMTYSMDRNTFDYCFSPKSSFFAVSSLGGSESKVTHLSVRSFEIFKNSFTDSFTFTGTMTSICHLNVSNLRTSSKLCYGSYNVPGGLTMSQCTFSHSVASSGMLLSSSLFKITLDTICFLNTSSKGDWEYLISSLTTTSISNTAILRCPMPLITTSDLIDNLIVIDCLFDSKGDEKQAVKGKYQSKNVSFTVVGAQCPYIAGDSERCSKALSLHPKTLKSRAALIVCFLIVFTSVILASWCILSKKLVNNQRNTRHYTNLRPRRQSVSERIL